MGGACNRHLNPVVAELPRWTMNRPRRIAVVLLALAIVAYAIPALFVSHPFKRGSVANSAESAITNPVGFAKSHVTGGIGALLMADPATGLPRINGVLSGSPAQRAGLRAGDVILAVDGVPTRGQTLAQNVENIRGLAIGSVALTIQRAGSTNLNCLIERTSWSGMGIAQ